MYVKALLPVAAFIQIAKIAMKMMVAMYMVMAVKKGIIIARAMKRVVTIPSQIGILITTGIGSIIVQAILLENTGCSMTIIVTVAHAQIIQAGWMIS